MIRSGNTLSIMFEMLKVPSISFRAIVGFHKAETTNFDQIEVTQMIFGIHNICQWMAPAQQSTTRNVSVKFGL